VTVWLLRAHRARWALAVTGLPCAWMYVMSVWALLRFMQAGFLPAGGALRLPADPVPWVALILVALAAVLFVEALRVLAGLPAPARDRRPATSA